MRLNAKASSAGSTHGTGSVRGLALLALVGGLALIVSLAFGAGVASAADPVATIDQPVPQYTTAQVAGTVDVHGESGLGYLFQYSTDGIEWSFFNEVNTRLKPLPASSGPQNVSAEFTGLKPGTEYQTRLLVTATGGGQVFPLNQPAFTTKAVTPPDATIDPVTTFTGTTAHFTGTIDVNAPAGPLSPELEAVYKVKWHFECTPECHGLGGGVVNADESSVTVSDDAIRLEAHTPYEVKLVATSEAGDASDGPVFFQTPLIPVAVEAVEGASDGQGGYTLEGVVTPFNSKVTDCHFEYGPTTAYVFEAPCSPEPTGRDEVQEFHLYAEEGHFNFTLRGETTTELPYNAPAAEVEAALQALPSVGPGNVHVTVSYEDLFGSPKANYVITFIGDLAATNVSAIVDATTTSGGGEINPQNAYMEVAVEGGNNLPVLVEAHVTGLTPNATYHFQIVATNSTGPTSSGDRIFVPTVSAEEENCPNATLRAENHSQGLPNCRAYEMVTPPTKNGYQVEVVGYNDDGGFVFDTYAGNIANSGSGGVLSRYVTLRTDAGWQPISNLNGPSGSPFSGPNALFGAPGPAEIYTPDLLSSIWYKGKAGDSGNDVNIYLRRPDGSFVFVGPGGDQHLLPQLPSNNVGGNPVPLAEFFVGASADLSHLVYNGGRADLYGPGVYEFVGIGNGQPRRVDLDGSGDPISECPDPTGHHGGNARGNAVSRDGSVIFFTAFGGCGGGNPPGSEIWARVDGTTSYEATESHCTRTAGEPGGACNAPANAVFEGAANDGSRVYFTTTQQLVNGDTDTTNDLYAYDLPSGSNPSPSLVEVSGAAEEANVEGVLRISDDGSRVYFVSKAILAANDDARGESASHGEFNLYVWQRDASHPAGQTTFVARLDGAGDNCLLWNTGAEFCHKKAQTTGDGRYLILPTAARLVPTDTDDAVDLYRYDSDTGKTVRVSTNIRGIGGNADGFDVNIDGCDFRCPLESHTAVSDDGEAIVFSTSEALSPLDGNGVSDVYLWNAGQVSLISTGAVGGDVGGKMGMIDASGKNLYFTTPQALAPADSDAVADVYDARVEGGYPVPRDTSCAGETCQPQSAGPAAVPGPATDRANGSGNVKAGSVTIKSPGSAERAKLAAGGKAGLKLKVSGPGKVSVKGTAKIGGKEKHVFSATLTVKKAGEVKLPISLSKPAQAQLRKDGSLTVQLSVEFPGAPVQTSKLVLKAPTAKPGHAKRRDG